MRHFPSHALTAPFLRISVGTDAEMAILRGNRAEAQSHAAAAERQLQSGTPAWQRAEDIKAYINSRPRKN